MVGDLKGTAQQWLSLRVVLRSYNGVAEFRYSASQSIWIRRHPSTAVTAAIDLD